MVGGIERGDVAVPVEVAVVIPSDGSYPLAVGGDRRYEASEACVAAHVEAVALRRSSGIDYCAAESFLPCIKQLRVDGQRADIIGHIPCVGGYVAAEIWHSDIV